jgi:hypothetical protein
MERKNSKNTVKLSPTDREIKKRNLQEELQGIKNDIFEKNAKNKEEIENLTERKKKVMAELRSLSPRKSNRTV